MSNDARFATPDLLERRQRHFAAAMPARIGDDVDRRVHAAIASTATRPTRARHGGQRGWPRRRIGAILVVAALLTAAAPAMRFFEGWGEAFDRVFALSTPIDLSATDDGYRVTVVRAYADSFGVRLAITAEDLEDRGFAELALGNPTLTDNDGREYPMFVGWYDQPSRTSSEGWLRFEVPAAARDAQVRHLTVALDGLDVRHRPAPTLANGEPDLGAVWASVPGDWRFEFDVESFSARTAKPDVTSTVGGITVTFQGMSVTPATTIGSLTFDGLRPVEWGWDPYFRVDHDGSPVKVEIMYPGSVQDTLTFEAAPGFEDLSGTWTITIEEFHRDIPNPDSDITTEQESIVGPWVLTFEGPPADAP